MTFATYRDAMNEFAANTGRANAQSAWILTGFDVWVRNPHYRGPAQPHPELEFDYGNDEYADLAKELDDAASDANAEQYFADCERFDADYDIEF